ncbi:MAG: sulfatase [Halanaerobiales bacterium]
MSDKNRTNILLIHTDEHRQDCLGAYENKEINTPNIDKLAEEGVTYHNSFTPFPVCTPSRYSLLTGLYPHQHMGWTNHCNFPQGMDTFPEILRENGYNTKAVGKMHFTPTYLDTGFEEMELAEQNGYGRLDDDYHRYLKEKGLIDINDLEDQVNEFREKADEEYWQSLGTRESNLKEEDYKTTWIGNRAVDELENWEGNNNMLMVGFVNPHHPFDPPAPWSEMYNPDEISLLPGWEEEVREIDVNYNSGFFPHRELTEEKLKKVMAYYYAMISMIDYQVGRMVEILKDKGLYDNTMIIFTSDHGDYMGYHHMLLKQNHMYEPLMKVPLIIKYPDNREKGISTKMINNIDLAPTILDEAGLERGKYMEGNIISSEKDREYILAETVNQKEYMVRSKKRKLLLNKNDEFSQFFDLEKDPCETNNLIDDPEYKEEVEQFKQVLFQWNLFEAATPVYLNEDRKEIAQPNLPSNPEENREEMIQYWRDEMEKYQ